MDDPKLDHLTQLLERFLQEDIDITAPALVMASDQFKHPSDITRPVRRGPLFHQYRDRQARLREMARKTDKNAKGKLLIRLDAAEQRVAYAERRNELLVATVRGIILSVGSANGLKGWQKMSADYAALRSELDAMEAIPPADIRPIRPIKSEDAEGPQPD